jgi:translation elongation factor EF-Tu-like GTPase
VDDWDKVPSFDAGEVPRRSTSSLGSTVGATVFVDLLPKGLEPSVKVRALISMLATDQGGRRTGITSGYRPNHNFGAADGRAFYMGQVEFGSSESLSPGESREALIEFIRGPGLMEALLPGVTWRIQEGPKLVAIGSVIEILGET